MNKWTKDELLAKGIQTLFGMLREEVCGEHSAALPSEQMDSELAQILYLLSEKHDLAHIVGSGLLRRGMLAEDETAAKFRKAVDQAMSRYLRMEFEYRQVCALLEAERIPFIPLKGAVLRSFYPEPWMRSSCDMDILVREENLDRAVSALNSKLGYASQGRGYHDVSLFSPSGIHLELHFHPLEDDWLDSACYAVLDTIWEDALPVCCGQYQMKMSDEMFYYYHMAHMAMHLVSGGCGIRPFLDVWVLNNRLKYNPEKRRALLEKGKLLSFAQGVEWAVQVWFGGAAPDLLSQQLCEFVVGSGVYGTAFGKAAVQQSGQGGKLRYILTNRVFMPYSVMKKRYPVLRRRKWLLPVYEVIRWSEVLRKGRVRYAWNDLKANASIQSEERIRAQSLLEQLGLADKN